MAESSVSLAAPRSEPWPAHMENPKAVAHIFGDVVPDLTGVELAWLRVERGPKQARLAVRLREWPARAPGRWALEGFDQVELRFDLFARGNGDLSLRAGAGPHVVRVDFTPIHGAGKPNKVVEVTGPRFSLRLVADYLHVAGLRGCRRGVHETSAWLRDRGEA